MKNEEEDRGRHESVGDDDYGSERTSRSDNTRASSSLRRSTSSRSGSSSKTNLMTRSGRRAELMQRRASHSGRDKVAQQSPSFQAHTATPVKNVQVHLTKLSLSPESTSGRKLSAKKYIDKIQCHTRARRSHKTPPARSPDGVTLTGSGPSPRTKTVIEKLVAQRPRRTVAPKNLVSLH